MEHEISLPLADGRMKLYRVKGRPVAPASQASFHSRIAFAAAHVVVDPLATGDPASECALDWDATLAYRRHLWSHGFAVAEAMDTAQRGMGLTWTVAQELIQRAAAEARACGGRIACGAGTDHLVVTGTTDLAVVQRAYEEQCAFVEATGSSVILMASRVLAAVAKDPDDYIKVYGSLLSQMSQPVILHWLGDMFDPALSGYWGCGDVGAAMEVCLSLIRQYKDKIDGVKISLLDRGLEVEMRRRLPAGVKMYTGDDFHYPELIRGDENGFSHALLGIFDAIAPVAGEALRALDAGDSDRYEALLQPTVRLSRHIFQAPTRFYKTGIVFLAYLNGHQSHFRMVGGMESMRSMLHLCELFVLADEAGLLVDPDLACERMRHTLILSGVV